MIDPVSIGLILQTASALIKAAKSEEAKAIAESVKKFVEDLVGKKLVSVEEQAAINNYVDAIADLAVQGIVPPAWQVRPDPA